jgi:adenine-specific DNA methylase
VAFEIFEPKTDREVSGGTVTRAKATCLCCGTVLPPERVRAQLSEQRGGADAVFDAAGKRNSGARMLAVVTINPGISGRNYRLSNERDYEAVWKAQKRLKAILDDWEKDGKKGLCPVPDEPTPAGGGSGAGRAFSVQKYGMMKFRDLFTARQTNGLSTICKLVDKIEVSSPLKLSCKNAMALVASRCADYNSGYARWAQSGEFVGNTFGRQALGPSWDFCETFLLSSESGGYPGALEWVSKVIDYHGGAICYPGQVEDGDACSSPLPDESCGIWFTDPPYYDAVPYSDLSDYFFVWQKRSIHLNSRLHLELGDHPGLTPKTSELVQDETKQWKSRPKDKAFFEDRMSSAFSEGRRILRNTDIGAVVFAHKTTEGWEALLNGMIQSSWKISASWPIASERPGRLRSQDSAALATSVHLVCRPRPEDAPVGDWVDVLRELPNRVGDWMERLQREHVRGADLVFACIGPALEIFSRYRSVETADGREVKLAEYLEKVWEVVGRTALEQILGTAEARARNGMAGALEEDARLTALFLWTLQSTDGSGEGKGGKKKDEEPEEMDEDDENDAPKGKPKGYSLVFDVVRRFAQPLGIDLPRWEGRIIETKKGVVRLMAVSERAKQIFGSASLETAAEELLAPLPSGQMALPGFEELASHRKQKSRERGRKVNIEDPGEMAVSATTLDRVHAAMLLQAGGQANALRRLIQSEQDRGPDFLRLANALSALYPTGSEEKRLLDAMLLAVPR